jgi:hypothetical protein
VKKLRVLRNRTIRDWSPEQKVIQSRKRRGFTETSRITPEGILHYELVFHFVEAYRYQHVLAYEAMLNWTTLSEWITRHRLGGVRTGEEIYVSPGMSVVVLDKDLTNTTPTNLHCFLTKAERMSWQFKFHVLKDNVEKVREASKIYTDIRRGQLQRLGSTVLSQECNSVNVTG